MPNESKYQAQLFAKTFHQNKRNPFGIFPSDRIHHLYVIGKTGTGKTTLLENLIRSDIKRGAGFALLDPHGDLVEKIASDVPGSRTDNVEYINLADPDCLAAYNPLTRTSPTFRPLVAAGLMDVFRMMWSDAWGPRMEHVLRNTLLALLDQPHATIPDILRMMTEKRFRYVALRRIQNEQVRKFWKVEFPKYSFRYQSDSIAPIQNKVGALLSDPRLYRFFTGNEGQIRLRQIMDQGKILLINLSRGQLGTDSSSIAGGVLITMLGLAAFSRADTPEAERRPFFIYVDEFQNFTTLAIAEMLSELRKYGVGMVMAHQYLHQLQTDIRHAVLGNAGTLISFRLGAEDAAYIAREFEPNFSALDLISIPNRHIFLRLMIDGAPSKPFSAITLPPLDADLETRKRSWKYN